MCSDFRLYFVSVLLNISVSLFVSVNKIISKPKRIVIRPSLGARNMGHAHGTCTRLMRIGLKCCTPSVYICPCLRFSRNRKPVETSNLEETQGAKTSNFSLSITWVEGYTSTKCEVSTALRFRINRRHRTDGQTDGRSAALNAAS